MELHLNLTGKSASMLTAYRNSPDIAKLASYFGNAYEGVNYQAQERQKPCLYIANDWEDEINHLADVIRERRLLNHKCGIIVPTNLDLFSVTNKLKERGIEVHQAIAVRRGGTPPDFDSLTPIIASYHNAKGLTFDCVLLPKLVENNFKRVTGERRRRLLLVGITRATQWVYLSTVRGWEMSNQDIFRQAAANGDLFIKETATTVPVAAAPTAATGGDDDKVSFL
jgi:superfamily I DNA/RNA helicase